MSGKYPLSRARAAANFTDPNHPMLDEVYGPSRDQLDPGIAWPDHDAWQPPKKRSLRATLAAVFGR